MKRTEGRKEGRSARWTLATSRGRRRPRPPPPVLPPVSFSRLFAEGLKEWVSICLRRGFVVEVTFIVCVIEQATCLILVFA